MFYKSMAGSPGTKVAALTVSGSACHPRSLAPAAQVTSHQCSPGTSAAFPLLSPGASVAAGGDELQRGCSQPRLQGAFLKVTQTAQLPAPSRKQTSWVTFHARNAINAHAGLQSYRFQLP